MNYIDITIDLTGKPAFSNDIVVALLGEIGFESFSEEKRNLSAFIQEKDFDEFLFLETLSSVKESLGELDFVKKIIEQKNWNEEWESQFEPVIVGTDCIVRAPFHEKDETFTYDLIIEPKMSFGTGHHETTFLMLEQMLIEDFTNKTVADCGCGTGVLGIMAEKLGAKSVFSFDYDELCYINTQENVVVNSVQKQEVSMGDLQLLEGRSFDVILANINRNILTSNMHRIAQSMKPNSRLLMSGFYEKDIPIVEKSALEYSLKFVSFNTKNNWTITVFSK